MQLRNALPVHRKRVRDLENVLLNPDAEQYEIADANMRLADERAAEISAKERVRRAEQDLGIQARAQLKRLLDSPFIQARMNARAAKIRLRHKLQVRKFELDKVERTFRKQKHNRMLFT